ncbi:tRNA lysidine(34) synthetase TilS [Acidisoma sp. C75]
MAPFGPFPPGARLGLAVSGGADSLCLALLAAGWSPPRQIALQAFIVDHGLRPDSGAEAAETAGRLASLGLAAEILRLRDFSPGPALSARARAARYAALEAACQQAGILDLMLGHHRADQAETVLLRALGGSGPHGLAGMAPLVETQALRLLRPLLTLPPGRLRATLAALGLGWVEDPSNRSPHFTRARLRALRADHAGMGVATVALGAAAAAHAAASTEEDRAAALWLARHATLSPFGFALLPRSSGAWATPWPPRALAQVIGMVGGRAYPPPGRALARIAADPEAAIGRGITLAGVRLMPAGRLGPGFLICREAVAMAPAIPATAGAVWDGRFRLALSRPPQADRDDGPLADVMELPPGSRLGPLGRDAPLFRAALGLPRAVLETIGCLRGADGSLCSVAGLGAAQCPALPAGGPRLLFAPRQPASAARFTSVPALA